MNANIRYSIANLNLDLGGKIAYSRSTDVLAYYIRGRF